ncbi:MAG TPA: copper chaperone PCu(A)C [Anaerolineae bacterium]|jgi:copper(I)-binding protein|nr:copper chaperone PCu(A)C [Anaerolineae bacterium]
MKRFALLLCLLIGLLLAACTAGDQDNVTVEEAWGRPSPKSAANAAFYMAINNSSREDDTLTKASLDICGRTELHLSAIDDEGVMSMQQVQQIDIPAGESVVLEPGGLHVMCIDRQTELNSGDRLPITLSFAHAGEMAVEAEIRDQ